MTQQDPAFKDSPAIKHDAGKVRLDLLPWLAVLEVGAVGTAGSRKYDDNNWRKGMPWMRLVASAMRHIFEWVILRRSADKETGLHPLAHAAWCLLALVEYERLGRYQNMDNRPYSKPSEAIYYQALLEAFEAAFVPQYTPPAQPQDPAHTGGCQPREESKPLPPGQIDSYHLVP
jgi:Domain of unknown function (DUF5664)